MFFGSKIFFSSLMKKGIMNNKITEKSDYFVLFCNSCIALYEGLCFSLTKLTISFSPRMKLQREMTA